MKRLVLLITFVFLTLISLRAQNTCGDQLKVAQRRFDDGLLDDIPQLLENCMKSGFTKEEKTNAYKLLIQTYLFSENQEKADEVMLKFLNEFPSYSIATNDPKEFVNLFGTYRTKPIFKLELKLSASFLMPNMVEPFGVSNINKVTPTYKTKPGIAAELNYLNTLYKNFDYSIGASLTISSYSYTNRPFDYSTVTGTFKNTFIGFPCAVKYNYKIKGVNLFAKGGFEFIYLLKSTVDLKRVDKIVGRTEPITGTEDLIGSQNVFDFKPLLGIGVSFKIGRNWLNISTGYKFSTMSQLNKKKFYSNSTLESKYLFAPDKLLLNQSHISVSFIRPVYKPKKI